MRAGVTAWLLATGPGLVCIGLGVHCGSSGASADAGTDDGGPGRVDSGPEAASDTGADMAVSPEASAQDAGAEVGLGSSFCSKLSPQPTFCSDFDEGPGSLSTWEVITSNGYFGLPDGGFVTLDTTTSTSAPASAHESTLPTPADAGVFRALVFKSLGLTGTTVNFGADVLIAGGDTIAFADLSFLHPNGTEDDLDLDLIYASVDQSIPAGDSGAQGIRTVMSFPLEAGVPRGTWHRISMDLVAGPPASLTVMLDTSVVLDAAALDPRFSNGTVFFGLGVTGPSGSPGQDMHLDNVVVDTKP